MKERANLFTHKVARFAQWSFLSVFLVIVLGLIAFFFITFDKYDNQKEGWSLFYPRGWKVETDVPAGAVVAFVAPKANPLDFFQDNIAITYTRLRTPMTLAEYVETAKMQMTKTLGDITVAESQLLNISGRPGAKLLFQATGSSKLTFVVYVFIFNDVAYNITYAAMTDHYEKTGKYLFEVVMTTLKVMF